MGPQYICTLMDFTPKCKLSFSLTYPHITPKLYDLLSLVARKIKKNVVRTVEVNGVQCSSKRGKLVIQAWNDEVSKNFHIWVNYYFKFEMQLRLNTLNMVFICINLIFWDFKGNS